MTETTGSDKREPENWQNELVATMQIFPDFISPEEEKSFVAELEPYLKRLRYESSHWDDVSFVRSRNFVQLLALIDLV